MLHTVNRDTVTPLSDTACRQAKPKEKPYKLADVGGLYLLVNATGKYWRWDYRHAQKRKTMALGVWTSPITVDNGGL
jgi:hypothetical protein